MIVQVNANPRDPFSKAAAEPLGEILTANALEKTESLLINPNNSTPNPSANLTLNFHAIAVAELLELLAEYKGMNLVLSENVQGTMTVHLSKVSWEQALDTVLTMQGLGKYLDGSVLLIAPLAELQAMIGQRQQAQKLNTALIQTHYAKAVDLAALLQSKSNSLLSERGSVIADARSNRLWINDTPQHLAEVHAFLQDIDIPERQIAIAARIINIDEDSMKDLGLRFGTVAETNSSSGPEQLHMDAPITSENVGQFTLAIAKLRDNTLLNLELSALEREGRAQIISNPQLITANQQPAVIESGQEIPYQEKTASGATNIAFKKAVLSLKVTPEITADNKILLSLAVNQDKISALSVNGVPAISTQEIQTQISVANGETLVLGGIFEQSNSQVLERVPFLGSIPLLGAFFSHKQMNSERKELLIFVTPSIVSP